jgi:hypothetical protein
VDSSRGGSDRQTIRTQIAAAMIPSPTIPNNSTGPLLSHAPRAFVVALLVGFGIGISAGEYVCTGVGAATGAD